jgi:hypothetical protein
MCSKSLHLHSAMNSFTTVTTFAGTGVAGAEDGVVGSSQPPAFSSPSGLATSGDLIYVADRSNNLIRQITLNRVTVGGVTTQARTVSTVAGAGGQGGFANGVGVNAIFNQPQDVVLVEDAGNSFLLVSDRLNNMIRSVALSTFEVTVFAGSASRASGSTNGVGTAALFNQPMNMALDPNGAFVLIADYGNNRIRQLDLATARVTSVAGSSSNSLGWVNGVGTNARFRNPAGLAFDPTGAFVFVADYSNRAIRKMTLDAVAGGAPGQVVGTVSDFAGASWSALTVANPDGVGSAASFSNVLDAVVDPSGTSVYVVDQYVRRVRSIEIATARVAAFVGSTAVGAGVAGSEDGVGSSATFQGLGSIAVDPYGTYMLVADLGGHRVRMLAPAPSLCDAGYYCPAGSNTPRFAACNAGQFCPAGSTAATGASFCRPGFFCPGGGIPRVPFRAGTFSSLSGQRDESSNASCFAGHYCPAGSSVGTGAGPCAAGFYCDAGASTPRGSGECQGGYHCPAGSTSKQQQICMASFYCPPGSQVGPVACDRGEYCDVDGLSAPVPCPAGFFCDKPAATNYTGPCRAGFYCPERSISAAPSAFKCGAGSHCPTGSGVEMPCTAGFYCPTALAQIACPPLTYCPSGSSAYSVTCPAGFVCTGNSVTPCASGSYCPGGNSPATICYQGAICPLQAMPSPFPCPAGSFCNATGLTVAALCPAGTYCAGGSSAPVACPSGRVCNVPGLATPAACPPGAACSTAAGVSATCQPGSYAFGNASACSKCVRGLYSTAVGALPCSSLIIDRHQNSCNELN